MNQYSTNIESTQNVAKNPVVKQIEKSLDSSYLDKLWIVGYDYLLG